MKYKVKFWNDSIKDFQMLEYPYLENALLVAHKLARKTKDKVFIIEREKKDILVVECND